MPKHRPINRQLLDVLATDSVELYHADMRVALARLADNSLDACVTDPPYHLVSIVKRFGRSQMETGNRYNPPNRGAQYKRLSRGFMGRKWDGGGITFDPATWHAIYRVLKPGAHLIAFGGTRTYHRMACAVEDAGFEIRDCIQWLYGSGFPKSHDTAQSIEKLLTIGKARRPDRDLGGLTRHRFSGDIEGGLIANTGGKLPLTTNEAKQFDGWGTALKPAVEIIALARKPLSEKTVAANVLRWGTGALNIDGCRIATADSLNGGAYAQNGQDRDSYEDWRFKRKGGAGEYQQPLGRWPANVAHDGSDEVVEALPSPHGGGFATNGTAGTNPDNWDGNVFRHGGQGMRHGDSGSAARFFYTAKADHNDRFRSKHPTIKPVDLMQWLVRLITPRGGVVLDPFAGTGTTGIAAVREGMRAVLIEREAEYVADICRRFGSAVIKPRRIVGELPSASVTS